MIVLSLSAHGYAVKAVLAALVSLLWFSGCSADSSLLDDWSDYQQRLAKQQQLEPQPWRLEPAPQLPALRELRLELPALNLSLLDSLRLEQCQLGGLIVERNTSLGRLQQGVLRYYHDVQISTALHQCVATLEESQLRQRLRVVATEKQRSLPLLRAHALLHDSVLRNTLNSGKIALSKPDPAQFAPVLQALELVIHSLLSDHASELPSLPELQQALEVLDKSSYSGQLWRGFSEQRQFLEQLAPLLTDVDRRAGCRSAGVPERAYILRNIAITLFGGQLQPRLALYLQQGQALEPYLQQLYAIDSHPLMNAHLAQLMAQPEQLRQAVRAHAQQWQLLFTACDFSPQQTPNN